MSMLTPKERRALKESRIARFYEMERQFYTVTEFYPAQRLTIHIDQFKIMDIMNCDTNTACGLLKKIGKAVSNEFTTILRTSHFCDYMGIDEMLIQLFLASLNTGEPLPPVKTVPALTREEIATERPRKIQEVIEDLRYGIMESTETLQLRAKLYDEANPWGEPMYKRKKFVQMVIRAFEVAQIIGCHISTQYIAKYAYRCCNHSLMTRNRLSLSNRFAPNNTGAIYFSRCARCNPNKSGNMPEPVN